MLMKSIYAFILLTLPFMFFHGNAQTTSQKQVIQVSAEVSENPATITLKWPAETRTGDFYIYKKNRDESSWGSEIAKIPNTNTEYSDTDVEVGKAYDYYIILAQGTSGIAIGYVYAGVKVPEMINRGKIILLVDENYASPLETEIKQLINDLYADGWKVLRLDINRNDSIPLIKEKIVSEYNKDPENIKALYIFGHIPVPYSGDFYVPPDGHVVGSGGHTDAWPADVYYGDMDGSWTDYSVNKTTAKRELAWNIPGDGKFDQTNIPSEIELEIGRVDLFQMSEFDMSDTMLMKYYLEKAHNFKSGKVKVERRGLVDDNFTTLNLASTGWHNQAAMFGTENVTATDYFSTLKDNGYLWSYGCGAGSFTSCNGLKNGRAYTRDFASDTVLTVFTTLAGSYFGDWDNPNNFLKAPLASKPYCVASFWGGIPKWYVHHMAMGYNIGYGARLSQNNTTEFFNGNFNYSANRVHIALMGDPTLRLHAIAPPTNLSADSSASHTVQLSWAKSDDNDILGYNIYKARTIEGEFFKINDQPVTQSTYTDIYGFNGNNVYMVKAVKLEESGSGSYFNTSLASIDSVTTYWPASVQNPENQTQLNVFPVPSTDYLFIKNLSSQNHLRISVYNGLGVLVDNLDLSGSANNLYQLNISNYPVGHYFIKVWGNAETKGYKFIKK